MYAMITVQALAIVFGIIIGITERSGSDGAIAWVVTAFLGGFIIGMIGLGITTSQDFKSLALVSDEKVYFGQPNGKSAEQLTVVRDTNGYFTLVKTSAGKVTTIDAGLTSLLFRDKEFYYETETRHNPGTFFRWPTTQVHYTLVMPEKALP